MLPTRCRHVKGGYPVLRRALVTLLASCVAVLGGLAPAGVAHAAATTDASPATRVVSCLSSNVWLRLWGTLGETCHVGNGVILVSLPGIRREQILGLHTVCLESISRRSRGSSATMSKMGRSPDSGKDAT
jgi:hypothetical protein